jgi:hypothetical protein
MRFIELAVQQSKLYQHSLYSTVFCLKSGGAEGGLSFIFFG